MKIYVASSWRNERQPEIVKILRMLGHEVYDFRKPNNRDRGFHWSDIDPDWQNWTPQQFRVALDHPIAKSGINNDMAALRWCDACVRFEARARSPQSVANVLRRVADAVEEDGDLPSKVVVTIDGMVDIITGDMEEIVEVLSVGHPSNTTPWSEGKPVR